MKTQRTVNGKERDESNVLERNLARRSVLFGSLKQQRKVSHSPRSVRRSKYGDVFCIAGNRTTQARNAPDDNFSGEAVDYLDEPVDVLEICGHSNRRSHRAHRHRRTKALRKSRNGELVG